MTAPTPHPAAAQPPSPSRGEGDPSPAPATSPPSIWKREGDPGQAPATSPPSPLEGEGARRADEGLSQRQTDEALLAAMAERDLVKRGRARADWRTQATSRNRGFAKRMRSHPTEAERRLWALVRDKRLAGFKFRRQAPIGPYIVDILCADRNLVIELDGSQHDASDRDAVRDRWLQDQGYRVLRVWNNDMLARPAAVLESIWAALEEQTP